MNKLYKAKTSNVIKLKEYLKKLTEIKRSSSISINKK